MVSTGSAAQQGYARVLGVGRGLWALIHGEKQMKATRYSCKSLDMKTIRRKKKKIKQKEKGRGRGGGRGEHTEFLVQVRCYPTAS